MTITVKRYRESEIRQAHEEKLAAGWECVLEPMRYQGEWTHTRKSVWLAKYRRES